MTNVHLLRRLGFKESFAIVVGSIIGTGVFLKTAVMAQDAGPPLYVLLAWLMAGVLSFMGALTYAELGCLFPAAGGEYVFLREAYGPLTGFLFGWTRFWIASPGSIAAYAIGSVTFLESFLPMANHRLEMAIAIIVFFTVLNCFSVHFGGGVQTVMTAVKILMIFGLATSILTFGAGTSWHHLSDAASSARWKSWSGFGSAVLAALWAFDGWNNLPMAAGEIRDPDRVIPQSLAWGLIAVLFLYAGANLAYFLLCRLRKGYSWSKPFLTQRSRNATAEIHATIHGMARSSESVPPSNAMKSRLVIGVHRRYRPRTDTEPRRLCARHSPGERGKTKPLGAALALKAAGTAFHRCPEACRLQSDDQTHLT